MSDVKRYNPDVFGDMRENPAGEYVRSLDFDKVAADLQEFKNGNTMALLRAGFAKACDERDALRAELAEVKGQEAARKQGPAYWQCRFYDERRGWEGWETIKPTGAYVGQSVETMLAEYRAYIDMGNKYELRPLYTAPPASPDVEGLVKALEEVERRNDNPARFDAEIDHIVTAALSTWRQQRKA